MSKAFDRRDFFRSGASALTAGMALYSRASDMPEGEEPQNRDSLPYNVKFYEFSEYEVADTCWALSVGPDGRIYAAACAENVPGGLVKVVRYNEKKDGLDYLFRVADKVNDPGDSGRATQSKIHYSFAPSMHDGILYMATHLTAPPFDQLAYSPWLSWHDEKRCFRGSALLAFDTKTDEVKWWDTLIPKEGCRCMAHDEGRGQIYALSYPRDHLIAFDLKKRRRRDLGRVGSINSQALFLEPEAPRVAYERLRPSGPIRSGEGPPGSLPLGTTPQPRIPDRLAELLLRCRGFSPTRLRVRRHMYSQPYAGTHLGKRQRLAAG